MDEKITIPMERYQELLRKEIGFDYRQAELKESSWVATCDRIMFQLEERK